MQLSVYNFYLLEKLTLKKAKLYTHNTQISRKQVFFIKFYGEIKKFVQVFFKMIAEITSRDFKNCR
ncbi:hypothetical protein BpHYR1_008459 [Brachionus plicatilis]|uniref:Uncharacterized protein n=1 Tax=Brachionus plicatilis TaxID=10195 RepID=A0A3M7QK39_BRAPC|nr:hypothetical protein BpHYR1_008459 [Brachionus plicatilis]